MSLLIKNNDEASTLIPEGKHVSRCYAIIDLGIQENKTYGTKSPKVLIGWELSNLCTLTGRPLTLMQPYTSVLNPKSALRKLLESWRGKCFSLEELHGFPLESMLGVACYLIVKHKHSGGTNRIWPVVENALPFSTQEASPKLYHLPISFDLDYYTEDDYLSLPEFIRKKINTNQPKQHTDF